MPIRPSKEKAARFALAVVPELAEVFADFQREGKALRPPRTLRLATERLRAESYVRLYEGENRIVNALAIGVFGLEGVKAIYTELEALSEKEQIALLDEAVTDDIPDVDALLEELMNADPEESKRQFDSLSDEEKKDLIGRAHCVVMFLLAAFHNYVAVMVHGSKMTDLVPAAMTGDRGAYLKAVQIDKSLLIHHPYFRDLRLDAVEAGDTDFLRKILYWETKPALSGRTRFPALWMMFAVLDGLKCLDGVFTHEELLDLCDRARLDRFQNRIEDVNYLTKRLVAFRRAQKLRGLSMP